VRDHEEWVGCGVTRMGGVGGLDVFFEFPSLFTISVSVSAKKKPTGYRLLTSTKR
jgi:hypothetical protein